MNQKEKFTAIKFEVTLAVETDASEVLPQAEDIHLNLEEALTNSDLRFLKVAHKETQSKCTSDEVRQFAGCQSEVTTDNLPD